MSGFSLPDGSTTRSDAAYVKAWRELAEPIERLMGWKLWAFDPEVTFRSPSRSTVNLPVDLCQKIGELMAQEES